MNHLFVLRHGEYGRDDRLSRFGREQMETMAQAIKTILNGASAHIVSSTAPRALDSSEVLAAQLSLSPDFERTPYLWSGEDAPQEGSWNHNCDDVMKMVDERRDRADGLIMVAHYELVGDFPRYFLAREFKMSGYIRRPGKGEGVHFDLGTKTYQMLP